MTLLIPLLLRLTSLFERGAVSESLSNETEVISEELLEINSEKE